MKKVDWSEWTPEYPYWVVCDINDEADWHTLELNRYYDRSGMYYDADDCGITVYTRPTLPWPEWVPPVGTDCQCLIDDQYRSGKVVGHYDNRVIFQPDDQGYQAYILKQEFIGDRLVFIPGLSGNEKAIKILADELVNIPWRTPEQLATALIELGYTKIGAN